MISRTLIKVKSQTWTDSQWTHFIIFTWFLPILLHRHSSLSPKLHSRRKYQYLNMREELKTTAKVVQKYLLGRINLNYSSLTRLLSHHSGSHSESGKSISLPSNVFNQSPQTIQHELNFPRYVIISLPQYLWDGLKILFGKKEKEILPSWENASTVKHRSILHSVPCQMQRFLKAQ